MLKSCMEEPELEKDMEEEEGGLLSGSKQGQKMGELKKFVTFPVCGCVVVIEY